MSNKTKKCPYCGEDILAVAIKCKHCGSNIGDAGISRSSSDYGIFLLATPIVATLLIWFWVGNMNLLQSPANSLALIVILTIAVTAIVAAMEAKRVGMTSDREKGTYSPIAWCFMIALFWVIGYPAYLFKRRHYGLSNHLLGGIAVALIFVGSAVGMNIFLEYQKSEAMGIFTNMQRQLESLGNWNSTPTPSGLVTEPNIAPVKAPITEEAQFSRQATWTPSFDCTKASTFSEKAICTDSFLGKLDGTLAENYRYMLASDIGDGARNDLKATQRKWLADRNKCTDTQCLVNIYRKRIDKVCEYPVLSGLHPICTSSDDIK